MTKETTIVVAKGKFGGKECVAKWEKGVGFLPTGDMILDFEISMAAREDHAVGGTYFPEKGTAHFAALVFFEVFGESVEIKYNGNEPKIPQPAGPNAIY